MRVPLKFVCDSDSQENSRVNNGSSSGGQSYMKGRGSMFPGEDHQFSFFTIDGQPRLNDPYGNNINIRLACYYQSATMHPVSKTFTQT